MDYSKKTLTRDGAALLANDDADGAKTIIDYVITSDQLPDQSEELDDLETGDFHNPKKIKITSYQHQGATFQPEATWDNTQITLKDEYPIQMFGLLAHGANDNDNDETLLAVAVSDNDPFLMPATNKVPFTFTMALTLTYSNASNVTADVTNTDAVTHSELSDAITNITISLDGKYESLSDAKSAHASLSAVADSVKATVNSLNSNIGSDVSARISNATNELNSIESKMKMLAGQTPAAPQLSASMDTSTGTISYKINQPSKTNADAVYQYFVYYKQATDTTYQETSTTNTSDEISGLNKKSKYDVYVVAENAAGLSDKSNIVITDVVDSRVFGATWNRTSAPQMQRTDAAVGLQAGVNGAQNDFDNVSVWKQMKTVYDSNDNKFIRIPKFYIYKNQTGSENDGQLTIKVSLVKHNESGWYLPKCFWSFQNNCELPYVDVGAYEATVNNSQLQSISGVQPATSVSMDSFRQYARNMGSQYGILDIHTVDALTCLFVVEFATLDSKSIMEGCDSNNHSNLINNGSTDNHQGSSGTDSGNRNGAMNYRGVENLWGNLWQWVDGVNLNGGPVWVCDDQSQYNSNVYAYPYKQLSYQTTNGDTSSIGLDSDNPEANFATATNGNGSNYFCDNCGVDYSGCVPLLGGYCDKSGDDMGLFDWSYDTSSSGNSDYGARLIKKASV